MKQSPQQDRSFCESIRSSARLIDYFEANSDSKIDPKESRLRRRFSLRRDSSRNQHFEAAHCRGSRGICRFSGEGDAKLHRHIFGEAIENLTAGEYQSMAGNFLKSAPPRRL
jgi:hypothetical protein